jgi:hypothetical protein
VDSDATATRRSPHLFLVQRVSYHRPAQEDEAGCKDSPLLTRLAGCHISNCSKSDFDAAELQISLSKDPRTKHVEGKIEKIHYECTGKSALQVRRNAEQALRGVGFTLEFTGYDVPTHYATAHKGPQWVAVAANEMTGDSSYDVTTVLTEAMQQEMTSARLEDEDRGTYRLHRHQSGQHDAVAKAR